MGKKVGWLHLDKVLNLEETKISITFWGVGMGEEDKIKTVKIRIIRYSRNRGEERISKLSDNQLSLSEMREDEIIGFRDPC